MKEGTKKAMKEGKKQRGREGTEQIQSIISFGMCVNNC